MAQFLSRSNWTLTAGGRRLYVSVSRYAGSKHASTYFHLQFFYFCFFIYDTETQENSNGAKHNISCPAQGAIDEVTPGGRSKAGRLRKKFLSRNHEISLVPFSCIRAFVITFFGSRPWWIQERVYAKG